MGSLTPPNRIGLKIDPDRFTGLRSTGSVGVSLKGNTPPIDPDRRPSEIDPVEIDPVIRFSPWQQKLPVPYLVKNGTGSAIRLIDSRIVDVESAAPAKVRLAVTCVHAGGWR